MNLKSRHAAGSGVTGIYNCVYKSSMINSRALAVYYRLCDIEYATGIFLTPLVITCNIRIMSFTIITFSSNSMINILRK